MYNENTLLESCGFPDLVATSYGGRNRLCAEEFAKRRLLSNKSTLHNQIGDVEFHKQQWKEIEMSMLGGQSLAGLETCCEVIKYLDRCVLLENKSTSLSDPFHLIRKIYNIAFQGHDVNTLFDWC